MKFAKFSENLINLANLKSVNSLNLQIYAKFFMNLKALLLF
ncbi:hypothetical protein [Campylobacter sp. CS_ED2]|nr:hypothetical protein [Campylobacter sp. CS_ED2]